MESSTGTAFDLNQKPSRGWTIVNSIKVHDLTDMRKLSCALPPLDFVDPLACGNNDFRCVGDGNTSIHNRVE